MVFIHSPEGKWLSTTSFVNEEMRTTTIGLYSSISMGLSGMVYNFVGGIIIEYLNPSFVYLFFAFSCLIGIIILYMLKLKNKKNIINEILVD